MRKELSSAESHLWEVVESNQEKIVDMSIVQLSQFANVSTATIVRTMKKMGYTGYTAYRENLRSSGNYNAKFKILNSVDSTIKNVILKNEIELNNTLNNLETSTILKYSYCLAEKIQQPKSTESMNNSGYIHKKIIYYH